MANLTRGITYGATETLTSTKLHTLVDGGAVTDIVTADIQDSQITDAKISSVSGAKFIGLANIPVGSGVIPVANTNACLLSGDQNVAGVKTFSSSPIIPTPTTDMQASTKKYVDDNAGKIMQVVNVQTGAVTTGTTVIPYDDTVPQITEGTEFMALAITPVSATNKLKIDVIFHGTSSTGDRLAVALFQDTTANALACMQGLVASGGGEENIKLTHYMDAGTTAATTFKVRAGGVAGTITFNGSGGARKYGGVLASSITITEIKV
jgi:hypothetical protein